MTSLEQIESQLRDLLMLSGQIPAVHEPDNFPTPEQIARARRLPMDSTDYDSPMPSDSMRYQFEAGQNQRY